MENQRNHLLQTEDMNSGARKMVAAVGLRMSYSVLHTVEKPVERAD